MDINEKKNYSSSIVLIGDFSPSMFQPYWFKYFNILDDREYSSIDEKSTLVTPQLTIFQTEKFYFRIEPKRFIVSIKYEPFELLIDMFSELKNNLENVVVKYFGINFSYHIIFDKLEDIKRFGDTIAPKDYWSQLFNDNIDMDKRDGLVSMEMRKKTDDGFLNVKIESSSMYDNAVFFRFNYHQCNDTNEYDIVDVDDIINKKLLDYAEKSNYISSDLIKKVLLDV